MGKKGSPNLKRTAAAEPKCAGGGTPAEKGKRLGDDGKMHISPKTGLESTWEIDYEIATVDGVLSAEECSRIVAVAEKMGFGLATSRGPKYGEAIREHGRLALDDQVLAQSLWEGVLQDIMKRVEIGDKRACGLNPMFRIYKYEPGQVFGQHYDQSMLVEGKHTEYTLLVYLSGGLTGGETVFYNHRGKEVHATSPRVGRSLLHRHGAACLLHEARPVSKGTKY
eukprot:CAMPEP_0198214288 /NCGR_PEP_ID=MMETSP1445-20131203/40285_1 /TAXON_ID=36898 /ORGANISM="Pyramimonas sp., Strain CCMP2087" /LENGTH=223 /DNA_ID=CAMNT_0043889415 /DNA_START=178 /DNA_END=846 /DNA_ORIENTATION=+